MKSLLLVNPVFKNHARRILLMAANRYLRIRPF
jgi:hypothetical protein